MSHFGDWHVREDAIVVGHGRRRVSATGRVRWTPCNTPELELLPVSAAVATGFFCWKVELYSQEQFFFYGASAAGDQPPACRNFNPASSMPVVSARLFSPRPGRQSFLFSVALLTVFTTGYAPFCFCIKIFQRCTRWTSPTDGALASVHRVTHVGRVRCTPFANLGGGLTFWWPQDSCRCCVIQVGRVGASTCPTFL